MDILIWVGAAVSLMGVGLLFYCVVATVRARKNAKNDSNLNDAIQRLAAVNMGALSISAIGLMMVIMGIVFG